MSSRTMSFRPSMLLDVWWWHDAIDWFGRSATSHLKRFWWAWLLAVAGLATFSHFATLAINGWTDSLPQKVFIIQKTNHQLARDDYVAFKWHGGGPYPKDLPFVKIVKGVPGDVVTVEGRDFYVNGVKIATAKEVSRKGLPLDLGPTGVIPPGRYFVWTPHKDSFDSRYALVGWLKDDEVVGRAVPLW